MSSLHDKQTEPITLFYCRGSVSLWKNSSSAEKINLFEPGQEADKKGQQVAVQPTTHTHTQHIQEDILSLPNGRILRARLL